MGWTLASRAMAWSRRGLCAAGWLLLAGCGGGGGGGSTAPGQGNPPVALTLSSDIQPLASGDRRTWRTVSGPSTGAITHERVGEAVAALGGAYRVLSGGNHPNDAITEEYMLRSAAGISSVPAADSDALSRAAGPVEVLRFGIAQGQSAVLFDRTLSVDVDGDGRVDAVDLRIETLFVGLESVTTELATYAGASHVRTTAQTTIRVTGAQARTVRVVLDEWYAAGIGAVRQSSSTSIDGGVAEVETQNLVAYGVGAQHSDAVLPTVVASQPQSDGTGGAVADARLQFSEAMDPLAVKAGAVVLMRDDSAVVTRPLALSADGKSLAFTPVFDALRDGRYEIRHNGQFTDWAGNAAPRVLSRFVVDTTGPRLVSTSPAEGAESVGLTGTLTFTFNEALVVPGGAELKVGIRPTAGGSVQMLPATLQGNSVVALVSTPLQRNTNYVAWVETPLTDAGGNPMGSSGVSFRTDSGPLGRPQAWMSDGVVDSVAVADLDGDGRADLVFTAASSAGKHVGVRMQRPDGSYAESRRLFAPPADVQCGFDGLAVADMDGDGRADVVMHGGCSPLSPMAVLLQAADGSFSLAGPDVDLIYARAAPELNGNLPGVVGVLQVPGQARSFAHLRRMPDGRWQPTALVSTASDVIAHWQSVDLDADGRADLVWIQGAADNIRWELAWSLRTDMGWGAVQALRLPAGTPLGMVAGKLDDSGRIGVVLSASVPADFSAHSELWVFTKTATQPFAAPQRLATALGATALLMADLNGDGRMDLLQAHDGALQAGVYLQNGDGIFDAERLFEAPGGYFGYQRRALARADLNGDGRPDLIMGGHYLAAKDGSGAWPLDAAAPAVAAKAAVPGRTLKGVLKALGVAIR